MTETRHRVARFLTKRIQADAAREGWALTEIPDDFSLLESGVYDSLGFVELISALEDEFGVQMDFSDSDPEELMTLGGLVRASALQISDSAGGTK